MSTNRTQRRLNNWRNKAQNLEDELTDMDNRVFKLEQSLARKEKEVQRQRQQNINKDAITLKLENTLTTKEEELQNFRQEISRLKEKDDQNEHQILNEALEGRIGELSEELKAAVEKIRDLELEAQNLREELETANISRMHCAPFRIFSSS
eukprot:GHVP01052041.1.p1 GENE.GHVP01052041.1~~GHVP01052041.1.p1  ORF type:complete len:151 (+),score=37.33 GHVP01052041.1:199-651(+)